MLLGNPATIIGNRKTNALSIHRFHHNAVIHFVVELGSMNTQNRKPERMFGFYPSQLINQILRVYRASIPEHQGQYSAALPRNGLCIAIISQCRFSLSSGASIADMWGSRLANVSLTNFRQEVGVGWIPRSMRYPPNAFLIYGGISNGVAPVDRSGPYTVSTKHYRNLRWNRQERAVPPYASILSFQLSLACNHQ